LKLPSWGELVPHAQSNERVDPVECAGSRDGARTRPLKTELAKVDGSVDRQREIEFLVPVPSATKQVERRG
jgi:hypothetical protein